VTTLQDGAASANEIQTIGFVVPFPNTTTPYKITGSNSTDNSTYPILVTESAVFHAILPAPSGNLMLVRNIPYNASAAQFLARIDAALGALGTASSLYSIVQQDNATPSPDSLHLAFTWQITYQGALAGINVPQAAVYPASASSQYIYDSSTQVLDSGSGKVKFTNVTWDAGAATGGYTEMGNSDWGVTLYQALVTGLNGPFFAPGGNYPSLIESTQQDGSPTGINEIQKVTLSSGTAGGTFTLTFGANTTTAINWNAPATGAGSVQAALGALASIGGTGNVGVTGNAGGPSAGGRKAGAALGGF
ncbi:MAG: hypothetical protein KGL35_08070, partial [Bradyrhizobium sp.]|nr:hypothetical protein [Bradyrhizobium sp.]